MLIKNKKQGTVWDIQDEMHIKRLLANPKEYEIVNPVTEISKKGKE